MGLAPDRDLDRVVEVPLREPTDLLGHGGGEQRHLLVRPGCRPGSSRRPRRSPCRASRRPRRARGAELGEVEGALVEVVHDPARRADDDVGAAPQRGELDAVPLAAVDGQHVHARGARRTARWPRRPAARAHGWGEDERLRLLPLRVESVEDRQRERGRLSGARLGEADDVAPSSRGGIVCGLDRRGRLVPEVGERSAPAAEAEVGEGRGGVGRACHVVGSGATSFTRQR